MRWRRMADGGATLKTPNGVGRVWSCEGKWGGLKQGDAQAEAYINEASARRGVEGLLGFSRNTRGAFCPLTPASPRVPIPAG